jgi:hypothetical protein
MGGSKKIEFASPYEFISIPKSSKFYIPKWYKEKEKTIGGLSRVKKIGNLGVSTFKACSPFLDALTSGYIIELWQDIEVTQNISGVEIHWNVDPGVAFSRNEIVHSGIPVPAGHSAQAFAWSIPYAFKTPNGYSAIVTHPFNRYDLPFTTLDGVVDSDKGISTGSLPFYIKKDFEGIIPAGTPLAQIIPFKRDNWKAFENKSLIEVDKKYRFLSRRVLSGWYKQNIWKIKRYE